MQGNKLPNPGRKIDWCLDWGFAAYAVELSTVAIGRSSIRPHRLVAIDKQMCTVGSCKGKIVQSYQVAKMPQYPTHSPEKQSNAHRLPNLIFVTH